MRPIKSALKNATLNIATYFYQTKGKVREYIFAIVFPLVGIIKSM